jgi:hypothetical protein
MRRRKRRKRMRSFADALNLLLFLSKEIVKLEKTQKEILNSNLHAADKSERADNVADEVKNKKVERIKVLENLVLFPPHHLQYAQQVDQFCKDTLCEKSVFIMTKYPDGEDAGKDAQLQRVINLVKDAVMDCGYLPRLAVDKKYHANLWENVEIYLLGCARGIAIVENKFKPQLNPNIAMEWGWMRAMGKQVLYLVEKDVEVVPVDVGALIKERFQWECPEEDVRKAVFLELTGALPPPS